MITIADPEKALEAFLGGDDSYFEIEFESSTQLPNGNTEIGFSMQQAPRELGELISLDDDYDHDEMCLTTIDSDDSSQSVYQFIFAALGEETLEQMGITADEPVAAVLYGTTSAGEYSDDESDAYLSGTLIIGPQGAAGDEAVKKAREHMVDQINSNSAELVRAAINQLNNLPKYKGRSSLGLRQSVIDLNRTVVR